MTPLPRHLSTAVQGLVGLGTLADVVQQPVARRFGADVRHAQPALAHHRPERRREVQQGVRAREAPPGHLKLRRASRAAAACPFRGRRSCDRRTGRSRRPARSAGNADPAPAAAPVAAPCLPAEHRRHAAERAAKAAAQRRLVPGGAPPQIGRRQVAAWVPQPLVGQLARRDSPPGRRDCCYGRSARPPPASPGDVLGSGSMRRSNSASSSSSEGFLTLAADGVVDNTEFRPDRRRRSWSESARPR